MRDCPSVPLGNRTEKYSKGDVIGVLTRWKPVARRLCCDEVGFLDALNELVRRRLSAVVTAAVNALCASVRAWPTWSKRYGQMRDPLLGCGLHRSHYTGGPRAKGIGSRLPPDQSLIWINAGPAWGDSIQWWNMLPETSRPPLVTTNC